MEEHTGLPKTFEEFVEARKQGFLTVKEFKENGGKLAGCLCLCHSLSRLAVPACNQLISV